MIINSLCCFLKFVNFNFIPILSILSNWRYWSNNTENFFSTSEKRNLVDSRSLYVRLSLFWYEDNLSNNVLVKLLRFSSSSLKNLSRESDCKNPNASITTFLALFTWLKILAFIKSGRIDMVVRLCVMLTVIGESLDNTKIIDEFPLWKILFTGNTFVESFATLSDLVILNESDPLEKP